MKITIVYDNESWEPGLQSDWGFACLIETGDGTRLLFDTGAKGAILLDNLAKLNIAPQTTTGIFISHGHWDHTGGLLDLLKCNPEATVFLPASCPKPQEGRNVKSIQDPCRIAPHFWSTGELDGGEQSLVIDRGNGLAVICGCAHPGVGAILKAAARFGRVTALVGGLHGFRDFDILKDTPLVCPCHCTQYKNELAAYLPGAVVPGGAGKILEL